jgi:hypothetical protein
MITSITEFKLPAALSRDEAKHIFLDTAPTYQGVPGLIRKCYYVTEQGDTVGGIYLWETRADAEAVYTESWRAFVREKYNCEPNVTYLDTPVIVDNLLDQILSD